ncbi:expressed unknown protein [Seminavis robusta]|uniref:Uncharacterized protein n=1 Tax=Seminavis robusta TaxID=568900 RepID=A0A9N8HWZ1_9STRA|nr:expressed unknown protein [Seminavis robusta]|eukprot:Sro2315_g322960.1 n/a (292) ;mRNA; r:5293-6168
MVRLCILPNQKVSVLVLILVASELLGGNGTLGYIFHDGTSSKNGKSYPGIIGGIVGGVVAMGFAICLVPVIRRRMWDKAHRRAVQEVKQDTTRTTASTAPVITFSSATFYTAYKHGYRNRGCSKKGIIHFKPIQSDQNDTIAAARVRANFKQITGNGKDETGERYNIVNGLVSSNGKACWVEHIPGSRIKYLVTGNFRSDIESTSSATITFEGSCQQNNGCKGSFSSFSVHKTDKEHSVAVLPPMEVASAVPIILDGLQEEPTATMDLDNYALDVELQPVDQVTAVARPVG